MPKPQLDTRQIAEDSLQRDGLVDGQILVMDDDADSDHDDDADEAEDPACPACGSKEALVEGE